MSFTGCQPGDPKEFTSSMVDCCTLPSPFPGSCLRSPGPAPSPPGPTPSPPGPAPSPPGLPTPEAVGVSIGAVAALGVAGVGVFMLKKRAAASGGQEALLDAKEEPAFDPYTGEPLNGPAREARRSSQNVEAL